MGSSYTDYKGKGFWARDGQVEVWLYLLVEEISLIKEPPSWLENLKKEWHIQATVGFNGCVTAGLDEYIDTEEKRKYILALSKSALKKIRSQSPELTVKAEYSYGADGPEILCNAVDYRIHECYAIAFIELLEGEVLTNASNSKMVWPKAVWAISLTNACTGSQLRATNCGALRALYHNWLCSVVSCDAGVIRSAG